MLLILIFSYAAFLRLFSFLRQMPLTPDILFFIFFILRRRMFFSFHFRFIFADAATLMPPSPSFFFFFYLPPFFFSRVTHIISRVAPSARLAPFRLLLPF